MLYFIVISQLFFEVEIQQFMLIRLIIQPTHIILEFADDVFVEFELLLLLHIKVRLRNAFCIVVSANDVLDVFNGLWNIVYCPLLSVLDIIDLVFHYYVWHLNAFSEM